MAGFVVLLTGRRGVPKASLTSGSGGWTETSGGPGIRVVIWVGSGLDLGWISAFAANLGQQSGTHDRYVCSSIHHTKPCVGWVRLRTGECSAAAASDTACIWIPSLNTVGPHMRHAHPCLDAAQHALSAGRGLIALHATAPRVMMRAWDDRRRCKGVMIG